MKSVLKATSVLAMVVCSTLAMANTNVPDTVITAEVKAKVAADQSIPSSKVHVRTEGGIVYLSGKVDSDSEAGALIEMTQSIDGVKDVDASELNVKGSEHVLSDTLITSKVKGLFVKEKLFSNSDVASMTIHVETTNGVVHLTGTADTQEQAKNAVSLAKSVKGVKDVQSRVKVDERAKR